MNFKLKDKPLAFQIWIILGLVLGLSFTLVTIFFPLIIRRSFTQETFERIGEAQKHFLEYKDLEDLDKRWPGYNSDMGEAPPSDSRKFPFRVVNHIFLERKGEITGNVSKDLKPDFIDEFRRNAGEQESDFQHYTLETEQEEIMYVIRKTEIDGKKGFLISYLWSNYRENLVKMTLWRLVGTLIFVLLVSWIASIYIARYLTRPLTKLQDKVKKIARKNWSNSVDLEREDEIGQLGRTIEWMRSRLVEQNEKQQSFLQEVSHELKTPVMVIKSYVQSIKDGIFPRGDLESSIGVIEEESQHLERRVRTLLNLSKLDYFSTQRLNKSQFQLEQLIRKKVDIFTWKRAELELELELESQVFDGDKEKITVLLENLLDNQVRYADNIVYIKMSEIKEEGDSYVQIRIWNDGPRIEPEVMDNLFNKFEKGDDGEFGLGLAIVRVIAELHGGKVKARNEEGGVAFYIWRLN